MGKTEVPVGISILWEDESILGINKPPGLLSLPDGYDERKPHLRAVLEPVYGRLWVVHRLDRLTSGVLVLARSAEAHKALNDQFALHTVTKVYHALVLGRPKWEQKTVNLPLRANVGRKKRTVVDPTGGKPALTRLRLLGRFPDACLVEAIPETGRTHQVRSHLTAVGHPIIGDELYFQPDASGSGSFQGKPVENHGLMLHAYQLSLLHPASGQPVILEAPYPGGFTRTLEGLQEDNRHFLAGKNPHLA